MDWLSNPHRGGKGDSATDSELSGSIAITDPLLKQYDQPVIVAQAVLSGDEVAIGTSILAFVQYLGAATFISSANTLFDNGLISSLHDYAPQINATSIVAAGATGIKGVISAADLPRVLLAFNRAITQTFVSICKSTF